MKANEAIRSIMKTQEVKLSTVASRVGISSNALNMRLSQDNISISKLNEILRAMDYKIVAVPRNARVTDGGYEVE